MSKKAQKVQAYSGCKGIQGNTYKAEIKCVCIINKKTELNIMVHNNVTGTTADILFIQLSAEIIHIDIKNAELIVVQEH